MDWSKPVGRFLALNLGPLLIAIGIWMWVVLLGGDTTAAMGWLIGSVIYSLFSGIWIFSHRNSTP